jgi:hypothetical protein
MSERWLQEYISLAFRIHKVVQITYDSPFVEAYYGPPEWQQQAEAGPEMTAAALAGQARALAETLPAQGFAPNRTIYLGKHVKAMETLCRKLGGESIPLAEQARDCLDLHLTWTSEARFEQAHRLYDSALPGRGNLAERLAEYIRFLAFPKEQSAWLADLIARAFAEARQRTGRLINLPGGEYIEVQLSPVREHEGAARYRGSYRTRIEMNLAAAAAHPSRLFDHKICHEGYPGHHTEYVLKEQQLARQRGYSEQTIVLTLSPQCVLTEGIAVLAHEIIFAPGEAEAWIVEQVYRPLGKEVEASVLLSLRQAWELLHPIWDNAALLLDQGQSEEDVSRYVARYMVLPRERAAPMVASLKHPLWGLYSLTYAGGKKLLRPWLEGPERLALFQRFLTEQFVPSQLEASALPLPE